MKKERYGVSRIAYELWCLQEDRRSAGLPVQSLSTLIGALQTRHPRLAEAMIDQAVALFLARQFEETRVQLDRHRQWQRQWQWPSLARRRGEAS